MILKKNPIGRALLYKETEGESLREDYFDPLIRSTESRVNAVL